MKIKTPLTKNIIKTLKAGDEVALSGTIYTARDQAHKKLLELIKNNKKLPINLKDQIIFYAGPTPSRNKNKLIGSIGPTTASRMDFATPTLLKAGLAATIGKGERSKEVKKAIKKHKAVYFVAIGGAAAYLAQFIKKAKVVAYKELGTEAIYKLEVRDLPVIVAIDSKGKSIFK